MSSRRTVIGIILGLGLALAAVAYVTAPPPEEDPDLYDLEHSKRHVRDLERIGGKSAVLVNDLDEWLAQLWEGKARAVTILGCTAVVAGAYGLVTRRRDGPR